MARDINKALIDSENHVFIYMTKLEKSLRAMRDEFKKGNKFTPQSIQNAEDDALSLIIFAEKHLTIRILVENDDFPKPLDNEEPKVV